MDTIAIPCEGGEHLRWQWQALVFATKIICIHFSSQKW